VRVVFAVHDCICKEVEAKLDLGFSRSDACAIMSIAVSRLTGGYEQNRNAGGY
jgi:hypothetical protein